MFAPKHALAMAHAIEGGKCKVWEKWPSGQPQAGGSEYLELRGAFSIALRAPGAALLRKAWLPCRARSAGNCVGCCFSANQGRRCGQDTGPLEVGGEGPKGRRQGGNFIPVQAPSNQAGGCESDLRGRLDYSEARGIVHLKRLGESFSVSPYKPILRWMLRVEFPLQF